LSQVFCKTIYPLVLYRDLQSSIKGPWPLFPKQGLVLILP